MSDTEDNEISFTVKFLGRVEVVRPDGLQNLEEAAQSLKEHEKQVLRPPQMGQWRPWIQKEEEVQLLHTPDEYSTDRAAKKSKVHLFLSLSGVDILENKTKFLLYTCPLSTISFCAVLPSSPKVFGYVVRHPAADMHHCYLFQSKKFSHVLVSVIGDAFRASQKKESIRGGRDLIVEALRHKIKLLQRENAELKRKLAGLTN